ncbi:lactonase family protein [Streptomyces sp. NBC_00669]|uniref:lactonase family protein n=1 Tax=Streptomyces sp. NBC_00669 TaxID=2976011 RepID=UPI002E33787F|nr:beta-propeller fold lactonase family protein [Streptomyces sp. NBC_00669]
MKRLPTFAQATRIAVAAAGSLAVFALPAGSAAASPAPHPSGSEGPVFVQTDNTAANKVVAYHRAADGSLHRRGTFATGGKGGMLDGSVVDHLASQGSLAYDCAHHLLFAVNAGSDTVTVFSVDGDRLHREQVIGSGGSFPVSVTVHQDRVYVLNAREGGSVQGYRIAGGGRLERVAGWNRHLGLDTTTAPEFTHTPGQVSFTPDGSQVVVTTKAGGSSIDVFGVRPSGALSARPVVNVESGAVPFGFTFDGRGRLVVTDAGTNAVLTFAIRRDGTAVRLDDAPTGEQATCWIVRAGDRFYASNAGSNTLSGFRQTGRATLEPLGNTATGDGTVDSAVTPDQRFLYVQTGATGGVDAFRVRPDGSLGKVGTVTVPDAVGGEGIVAL